MFRSRGYKSLLFGARWTLFRRMPATPRWRKAFSSAPIRRYRAINHQRLLASWNAMRIWTRNPMFHWHVAGIGLFSGLFYLYHLERAPVSGRLRFNIVSSHWENQLGKAWFRREMEKNSDKILPPSTDEHTLVQRVFDRLIPHSGLTDESWEVNVIDDPEISAFVLPGGKVFVYRGMLDFCAREDELAVVLGHEIAHNVVRHTSERLSRWLVLVPVVLISSLASGMNEDLVQLGIDVAFRLPHNRAHEKEADHLGLMIMAKSCYDPSAALDLWSRWQGLQVEDAPWFLTTHPSHYSRLSQFHTWLLEARRKRLSTTLEGRPHQYERNVFRSS